MVKTNVKTLDEYINIVTSCALDDDIYVIKDTECHFAFASEQIVKTYGFSNMSEVEGRTVYDIRSCVVELAPELFVERDKKIIDETAKITILSNYQASPISGFYIQEGAPIISTDNQVIGSIIKFYQIDKPMLASSLILNHYQPKNQSYDFVLPKIQSVNNIQLSEREQAVLFLLSLNYDTRQIAEILSKSERKIITPNLIRNNINQQLYIKMEVNSVPDLIEKYTLLKQEKLIPTTFNKQFITTLKYEKATLKGEKLVA